MKIDRPICLVTSHETKRREFQSIFPPDFDFYNLGLNIEEIQANGPDDKENALKIVRHKLRAAYELVREPVMVEDTAAHLACYGGFPGPYIKAAENDSRAGRDALYQLTKGHDNKMVSIVSTMGYYDGRKDIIVDGAMHGTVSEPRGEVGTGFDFTVVPDGYDQTVAELGPEIKNQISHRYFAAMAMVKALRP